MESNKKLIRPDRLLQKRLIGLSYSLLFLSVSILLLILVPKYLIWFLAIAIFITIYCLVLSLITLRAGEKAINFGGFANEVISLSSKAKRIDNTKGQIILENDKAKELFCKGDIIDFLEKNLTPHRNNNIAFQRLKDAHAALIAQSVVLSLSINNNETWLEIVFKPIYLKKTDIFETAFSIKKIKKDTYLYWSFNDVTAEYNMEQVFQSERQRLHSFLDDAPVGLYVVDKDYNIEYCNHAFAQYIGSSQDNLIGSSLKDKLSSNSLLPPNNIAWNGVIHILDKEGHAKELFVRQVNYRDDDKIKIRSVVVADLPNNKDLQQKLDNIIDENSWLFNFAPIGIVFVDKDGIISNCNSNATKFLSPDGQEIISNNLFDYISNQHHKNLKKEFDNVINNQKSVVPLNVNLTQEKFAAITYITPMKKLHHLPNSQADGLVIYIIDATEQKSLEVQYAQAQKMQAMGQLAGGVAHDFNNLLTAIIGFTDLLIQQLGVGDPSFNDLNQIRNNANRAAGLVKQLLAFSRKQPLQSKLIDITENFIELSQTLNRVLGERIVLKFHHGIDLGFIKVDPNQLSQVIINLAINAKDAMQGNGSLNIVTRTEKLLSKQQIGEDEIEAGEFVAIDVIDTGHGITKENLSRIFEPFFSTKQNIVGSGTGLGLAMVYGIVRQNNGFIKVDSQVDKGTKFSIYLPRFENFDEVEEVQDSLETKTISAQNLATSPKPIFGLNVSAVENPINNEQNIRGKKILFVEDEDAVRAFVVRALKKKGFEIVACNSAENALEELEVCKDFDLLLTDMVLPEMNGADLAQIVKQQIKDIKIILASGYSEEIARNELKTSDEFEFLAKPFSLGNLTEKVIYILSKE